MVIWWSNSTWDLYDCWPEKCVHGGFNYFTKNRLCWQNRFIWLANIWTNLLYVLFLRILVKMKLICKISFTPLYCWNTTKVCVKHQSINQLKIVSESTCVIKYWGMVRLFLIWLSKNKLLISCFKTSKIFLKIIVTITCSFKLT